MRIDSVVETESVDERSVEPAIVDGWKQRIPSEHAAYIGERADVVIRFGFGFLVGDVLSAPEHGVLSFHHGDITRYRGQPMGFWEFVQDEPVAGITVQQLTEELDAGTIAAFRAVTIEAGESVLTSEGCACPEVRGEEHRRLRPGDDRERGRSAPVEPYPGARSWPCRRDVSGVRLAAQSTARRARDPMLAPRMTETSSGACLGSTTPRKSTMIAAPSRSTRNCPDVLFER